MNRTFLFGLLLCTAAFAGCSARQVLKERDYGVVAIPSNSNSWPMKYRDKANKLMEQHFPEGYEIVREEEYVVGQTTTHNEEQDHNEVEVVKDILRVGSTDTRSTTTTTDDTEYRIHYRRR